MLLPFEMALARCSAGGTMRKESITVSREAVVPQASSFACSASADSSSAASAQTRRWRWSGGAEFHQPQAALPNAWPPLFEG
jgi:hypothetical protein